MEGAASLRGGGGGKEGVVEGTVIEADDMVVCVLQGGREDIEGIESQG